MPRAMWKGAISFGLVTIPVAVYPATEEKTAALQPAPARTWGASGTSACARRTASRRLRAHREGVRVREGPLRRADRRRLRRRTGRVEPRDRHPAVRRPRRDRPDDVQEVLLPHRRDRREGVHAPARGDEPGRGRHHEGQLPRQGAPRGAPASRTTRSCSRRCTGPTRSARRVRRRREHEARGQGGRDGSAS